MTTQILISSDIAGIKIARIVDGALCDVVFENAGRRFIPDTPVLGRIKKVIPNLQAAFVDIGDTRDGFLPLKDLEALDPEATHEGAKILVNVAAEAFDTKGARLTTNFSIAGELLAFVRGREGVFISRQIPEGEPREELKTFLQEIIDDLGLPSDYGPWGCIARTAAAEAEDEAIEDEFELLSERVEALVARANSATAPEILAAREESLALSIERLADKSLETVRLADRHLAEALKGQWATRAPHMAEKVVLEETDPFVVDDIGEQIERALEPRVNLPSGGWLSIETTEALTAIDINSGSASGKDQERNAQSANLEAAWEIARQVRLRGVGGLIVIDFLKLHNEEARANLTSAMAKAFAGNSASTRIAPLSEFGLIEMTRRRNGRSLTDQLTESTGWPARQLKSDFVAAKILTSLARERAASAGRRWKVEAVPEVIAVLEAMEAEQKAAALSGVTLVIDDDRDREDFTIRAED